MGCRGFGGYPIGLGIPGYPQYLLCEDHFNQLNDGLGVYGDMSCDKPKKFPYIFCIVVVVVMAVLCILL